MLDSLLQTINNTILNPILALLFAVGVLVFVWGIVEFMLGINMDDNEKRQAGKRHMFYGLVGMFIMTSAWSILKLAAGTVCDPSLPSCQKIINHI